jgi:hypothetical protein
VIEIDWIHVAFPSSNGVDDGYIGPRAKHRRVSGVVVQLAYPNDGTSRADVAGPAFRKIGNRPNALASSKLTGLAQHGIIARADLVMTVPLCGE